MQSHTKKGFTLLEILLVITLLAILFATVLYALNPSNIIAEVNDNKRKSDALTLYQALEQYALKTGSYPISVQNISVGTSLDICKTGAPSCADIVDLSVLVPNYISSIPSYSSNTIRSGFYIVKDVNGRIGIGGIKGVDNSKFVQGLDKQTFDLSLKVEYLIVAGGGGGGGYSSQGGGGGGGGVIYNSSFGISAGSYSVTVGIGGVGATQSTISTNGGDSIFSTMTAIGGGHGASYNNGAVESTSLNGGSGGGGAWQPNNTGGTGTPGQGNAGGNGGSTGSPYRQSGGGGAGGAGANGAGAIPLGNGAGGVGVQYSQFVGLVASTAGGPQDGWFGGGGGGSQRTLTLDTGGAGGMGGGGNGGWNGRSGLAGTGGGGGGGDVFSSGGTYAGAGGSGVVIVRYKTDGSDGISPSSTGGTKTTSGIYTIHTFTSSGTFTVVAN